LYEVEMMTTEQPSAGRQPSGQTLHLVPEPVWRAHQGATTYAPERFAEEGFVHCTDGEENVLRVGNTYYRTDPRPYLVLVLDVERLHSPVRYDDPSQIYPHVYGPINLDAVVAVRRVVRLADGSFNEIVEHD
jgi:uncharacterized protein (DUF952 family)